MESEVHARKNMKLTDFVVWSNLFYLGPIAVLWPLQGIMEYVLALALVSLTLGSGAYHWQGFLDGFGHRWDETAMMALLFALAVFVWDRSDWQEEYVLFAAVLLLPAGAAALKALSAFWYVPLLSGLSLIPAIFSARWMVLVPALIFVLAAVVRGKDDNHWHHGLWHLGASLAVGVLIYILPG